MSPDQPPCGDSTCGRRCCVHGNIHRRKNGSSHCCKCCKKGGRDQSKVCPRCGFENGTAKHKDTDGEPCPFIIEDRPSRLCPDCKEPWTLAGHECAKKGNSAQGDQR